MKSDKPESLVTLRPVNSFRYNQYSTCLKISLLCHSSVGKESACNAGHPSSIPGFGRSTVEGLATTPGFLGFLCGSAGKESACNAGNLASIPGLGRYPGEGKGYPLPYSGLENSMDYTVHGVTKSWILSLSHRQDYGIFSFLVYSTKLIKPRAQ